jgi:hypothetical protein
MLGHKFSFAITSLAALALSLALCVSVVNAAQSDSSAPAQASQSSSNKSASSSSVAKKPADAKKSDSKDSASASTPAKKPLRARVKAALSKINPARLLRDREYKVASAKFPDFCKDWERKLHDREANNVGHVNWELKNGYETGTYVGYGPVKSCETHQSTDGFAIGKLTYDQYQYYEAGKTRDEAEKNKRATDDTATTELFRWDKGKWFY